MYFPTKKWGKKEKHKIGKTKSKSIFIFTVMRWLFFFFVKFMVKPMVRSITFRFATLFFIHSDVFLCQDKKIHIKKKLILRRKKHHIKLTSPVFVSAHESYWIYQLLLLSFRGFPLFYFKKCMLLTAKQLFFFSFAINTFLRSQCDFFFWLKKKCRKNILQNTWK